MTVLHRRRLESVRVGRVVKKIESAVELESRERDVRREGARGPAAVVI
jgi:hypothetical protein